MSTKIEVDGASKTVSSRKRSYDEIANKTVKKEEPADGKIPEFANGDNEHEVKYTRDEKMDPNDVIVPLTKPKVKSQGKSNSA